MFTKPAFFCHAGRFSASRTRGEPHRPSRCWARSARENQKACSQRPDLPPSFLSRRTSMISMPRSTALHMSYTVRHATLAAVSASISIPVLPVTPQVVVTWMPTRPSGRSPSAHGRALHLRLRDVERMAHGDEGARLLGSHHAGHARARQHVAFRRLALHDKRERLGMHGDEALGHGDSLRVGFLRHVHHAHGALLVDMGKLLIGHGYLLGSVSRRLKDRRLAQRVSEKGRGASNSGDSEDEAYFGTRFLGIARRRRASTLRSVGRFRLP